MDQWGFFHPLLSDNDPIPEVHVAPPLTSQSEAEFLAKLPLVCKITAAYEKTPASKTKKRFFWRRKRCQYKRATCWVYGLHEPQVVGDANGRSVTGPVRL